MNVVVTGFGPFGEHKINASWEAVKLLPKYRIPEVNIFVEEIPVEYNTVEQKVPDLWKKYNPKLVIHVGVSSIADQLTIESQAYRTGYEKPDCGGNLHPTGECCPASGSCTVAEDEHDCIKSALNLKDVYDHINKNTKLKACVSTNAGRYLCEYTYYKSLHVNKGKTVFVHVPPLEKPYTAEELTEGLAEIIKCLLRQVS